MKSILLGLAALSLVACGAQVVSPARDADLTDAADTATSRRDVPPGMRSPVGARCVPARPAHAPGDPMCGGGGCFGGGEVYLEVDSPSCESTRCMVYRWDEVRNPDEGDRAFCTCRCASDRVPGPFCTCGAGLTCAPAFGFGDPAFVGSYCVPSAFVPDR